MRHVMRFLARPLVGVKQSTVKRYLPRWLVNRLKVYNYRLWLAYSTWQQGVGRNGHQLALRSAGTRRRILFYPDVPWEESMVFQICLLCGHTITASAASGFDLAVKWRSATFVPNDSTLLELSKVHPVVNFRCTDISKSRVDAVFRQVFGYSAAVDPRTYRGECVRKSNLNATHDGVIVTCPLARKEDGYVYQRVIANEVQGGFVEDIRVPICGRIIPLVFLQRRPVEIRFSAALTQVEARETGQVLSADECAAILRFCAELGLDYGELDVLRDSGDGRLYIVDANPTPHGPPVHLGAQREGLRRMAAAFDAAFMDSGVTDVPGGMTAVGVPGRQP